MEKNLLLLPFEMKKVWNYLFLLIAVACLVASCDQHKNRKTFGKEIDTAGLPLPVSEDLRPFSIGWENSGSSALNLSFILEKPAGKDGFITIRDGHFVKPDGSRFRMWGVNLTGGSCFPEKKDAPAYAAFLARFGINAVRLHFLDSNWGQDKSLFDYSSVNTRKLYEPQLDKLDFFISELKKAGIYSDINLNVGRTFWKGDGVPDYQYMNFSKAITLFNKHIIGLQKEYAGQLLLHVNPYTGNAYVNEPAVVLVEIVNENSLVEAWHSGRLLGKNTILGGGSWFDIPPYFGKELTVMYNSWLREKLAPSELAKIATEAGVGSGEEIPRLSPGEFKNASALRFNTEADFIIETEGNFYMEMYRFLKEDLKVRCPVIANSDHGHSKSSYALLSNISKMDAVDGHVYWQHPSARTDRETGKSYTIIENTPMVSNPAFSTVVQLSRSAVEGKPYLVSETNHPFPNEFACEGLPILSAYALLQDWDGIFIYTLAHTAPDQWNTSYPGSFGIFVDPVKMPGMGAYGLMFQRGDLQPAGSCVYRGYTPDEIREGIREDFGVKPFFTRGFSNLIPLEKRTLIRSFKDHISDYPPVADSIKILAETGEVLWNNGGNNFVEITAPNTESIIGFIPEETSLLKHLEVDIENRFAAITIISLDNKPVNVSDSMLLLACGKTGMTGMEWDESRKRLLTPGTLPSTTEVIKGTICISGLKRVRSMLLEPLDGAGNPLERIELPVKRGRVTIPAGKNVTTWYLLKRNSK